MTDDASRTTATLRLAMVYDMNACRNPTGVTRHALAQLERLSRRSDVRLRLVSGRISEADGLAYWQSLGDLSRASFRSAPDGPFDSGGSLPGLPWTGGPAPSTGFTVLRNTGSGLETRVWP